MNSILHELTKVVSEAFEKCGYERRLGEVSVSDRLDLCQFQCNGSFEAAKLYKKAPFVVAQEVVDKLNSNTIFEAIEVIKPGFINITLTDSLILDRVLAVADDNDLGIFQSQETIVLDYGGPNVAKPLHIGHLRAAIIGEALKRVAKAMGRTVVADVHLGDWGLQIGLVIAELEARNPEWKCFSNEFDAASDSVERLNVEELNELYPFASQKSKEDDVFKDKARSITAGLQNGHAGYMAVWQEIMRVSVADLKANYEKLNVGFDLWYGESDAEKYVGQLLEALCAKGLMYESEGAMVVDVSEETDKAQIPPIIIKKSDNSNIYATTDLATIIQRQKDFAPDKLWYVVDKRQGLHFTQVFRCAKKAELIPATTEIEHLGFGTMNGSDGKPYKTRDGGVMRLSDFLTTITNAAYEKMGNTDFVSEQEKKDVAQKLAIAAIKFGDLSNHRMKDYVFDIDKFLSFEGKTGTYLIYTVTRINSILKKAGVDECSPLRINGIYTNVERELFLNIMMTGEAFRHTLEEKAPNYICENAYKLSALFSSFYHDNHITNESDEQKRNSWIAVCLLVRKILLKHLDVLGIEAVESM